MFCCPVRVFLSPACLLILSRFRFLSRCVFFCPATLGTAAPICFQPFQFAQKCSEFLPRRRKRAIHKVRDSKRRLANRRVCSCGPLHQNGPLANPITEMARGRTLTTFRALPWGTRSARSLAPLSQAPRSPGPSFARPVACSERSSRKPCARSAPRSLGQSLAEPLARSSLS